MARPLIKRWPDLLFRIVALSLCAILLALAIAYCGVFNIAASAGHPHWLNWFLAFGKRRSVIVNSSQVQAPVLNMADLVPLGAAHFQQGCAGCHSRPGRVVAPVYDHMLPPPPDLQIVAPTWTREELFWIVRHGLQFTGMPAWSGGQRDDEVWAVVAFLEVLPLMKAEDYLRYFRDGAPNEAIQAKLAPREHQNLQNHGCDNCHGNAAKPPSSSLIPRLSGQNKAYLVRSLHEYWENRRQSGFMEPAVAELDANTIERLAVYYQSSAPAYRPSANDSEELQEPGRQLAEQGDRQRRIPACLSCHGTTSRPDYPRLAGQSKNYLKQQLLLWQKGGRTQTAYGALMATVARRMSERQITAAAEYFSSLPTEAPTQGLGQ